MVTNTIRRGMHWAIGPNIDRFEEILAEYMGKRYAVAFNSGTSALHAAMLAYGIGEGDEVIVPSFTFIATANAPLFVGARPVFADIEKTTYGLAPWDVRQKITPRTRAIIPVHYGGCPCLVNELVKIARENNLFLIEDAAEALGAAVNGKKAGSFGDCAILSFCANKVITTGEGGAIVTDSQEMVDKLRLIRSHGRLEDTSYFMSTAYEDYVSLGYNFRMSDITAALGTAQLEKADKIINMRRWNADMMSARLSRVTGIEIPQPPDNFFHVYQLYTIRVKEGQEKRDALEAYLAEKGIMTKVYFSPVHLTLFYKNSLGYNLELPVTEKVASQVLTLPMYPGLKEYEIEYITDEISAFFGYESKQKGR